VESFLREEYFSIDFVKKTLKKCEGESFVVVCGGAGVACFLVGPGRAPYSRGRNFVKRDWGGHRMLFGGMTLHTHCFYRKLKRPPEVAQ